MKTSSNYRQINLTPDLVFQWAHDPRFHEAVEHLGKTGKLAAIAERSAERCIENLIDLLSKGMSTEQAIDVVLTMAVNAGPAVQSSEQKVNLHEVGVS